ncbi:tellurite resistance TerB C-terminal domain-containing protein [Dyadobacter frigoris]|uniref:tellurite resistance TerB C-terminal domain-containing protein n=1 Tax=Dyadobacter frigoris TaxID=2576211 RepID=UPI0025553C3F|nr:tellurite resistance TerB C-terminal domain-containing protein [Dyadobacter frigoris]
MIIFLITLVLLILTPVFLIAVNRHNAKRELPVNNIPVSSSIGSKSLETPSNRPVREAGFTQSKIGTEGEQEITGNKAKKSTGETKIVPADLHTLVEDQNFSKSLTMKNDIGLVETHVEIKLEPYNSFSQLDIHNISVVERNNRAEITDQNESEDRTKQLTESKMALLREIVNEEWEQIDDSVIEVTNQSFDLRNIIDEAVAVPDWPHQYVYSYKAIQTANGEQLKFYEKFKSCFLEGDYLDIKGNSNYAFILLFDLIGDYNIHKNLDLLSKQFTALGNHYPKTDAYATTFFQRLKTRERESTVVTVVLPKAVEESARYFSPFESQEYWKLGSKYRIRLNLTSSQENLLNLLWNNNNNFSNIEYCNLEIIKLYLLTHDRLDKQFVAEASSLSDQLTNIADLVARKQYRYRKGSLNYKECIQTTLPLISNYLFKLCENQVRDVFGHKRKLSTDINFTSSPVVVKEFETVILARVELLKSELRNSIQNPDEKTEIELNGLNSGRWKAEFEQYKNAFASKPEKFFEALLVLGNKNRKNPAVESLFYEGFKFMAGYNKEVSLKLYILYVSHGLKLAGFENKKISKGIQNQLFNSAQRLEEFEEILSGLMNDKDAGKAIKAVSEIFIVKRKIVQLNPELIKEVIQKHTDTVGVLDKVLNQELDELVTLLPAAATVEPLPKTPIKETARQNSPFLGSLDFSPCQSEVLLLFNINNLSLPSEDFEAYCVSNGIFKNQLIDSINDSCFELLDDVLIEQDEVSYTIDQRYYKKLLIL